MNFFGNPVITTRRSAKSLENAKTLYIIELNCVFRLFAKIMKDANRNMKGTES